MSSQNYIDDADGRSSRRRIFILSVSLILLTALISGLLISGIIFRRSGTDDVQPPPASTADAIKSICSVTLYPESCFTALISAGSSDPEEIFRHSLTAAIGALRAVSNFPGSYADKADGDLAPKALGVCEELLEDAAGALNDTVASTWPAAEDRVDDLRTWLSAAITDFDTCLHALREAKAGFAAEVEVLLRNPTELASNSLAIASKLLALLADPTGPPHRRRRLLSDEFPAWVDRRILLQEKTPEANFVVAKDGSGNFKTLTEAVSKIPANWKGIFVIYVKGGTYKNEHVVLNFENVMIYGDKYGTPSVISGGSSILDGSPTYYTAPLRVMGNGFYGRDLVFQNTAGAEKGQAAAFVSQSDCSVCYRCTFDSYQDTLYVHSYRQFYLECKVMGTIDFILGNAAAVFQNCSIMPRNPAHPYQYNTITAQARNDENQNTGISIHRSVISPLEKLTVKTFLGRPWGISAATVVMKTQIDKCVDPAGWIQWENNSIPQKNVFYGEYHNTGLGADTSRRVNWTVVYTPKLSDSVASNFIVDRFIDGKTWLPHLNVTYNPNL